MILISAFGSLALFYTDPGTGTLLLQLLAAAFLGLAFYFRYFTRRVKGYFSKKKADEGNAYSSTGAPEVERPPASSDLSEKIE